MASRVPITVSGASRPLPHASLLVALSGLFLCGCSINLGSLTPDPNITSNDGKTNYVKMYDTGSNPIVLTYDYEWKPIRAFSAHRKMRPNKNVGRVSDSVFPIQCEVNTP